jgi:hypothetical protein
MPTLTVGVIKELAPGERRVALVPEVITRVRPQGWRVLIDEGAGAGAWFADDAYADVGATVVTAADVYADADVVVCVGPPGERGGRTAGLRAIATGLNRRRAGLRQRPGAAPRTSPERTLLSRDGQRHLRADKRRVRGAGWTALADPVHRPRHDADHCRPVAPDAANCRQISRTNDGQMIKSLDHKL